MLGCFVPAQVKIKSIAFFATRLFFDLNCIKGVIVNFRLPPSRTYVALNGMSLVFLLCFMAILMALLAVLFNGSIYDKKLGHWRCFCFVGNTARW